MRLHSLKLTYPLKMVVSNRNLLFQGSIFRCELLVSGRVSGIPPFTVSRRSSSKAVCDFWRVMQGAILGCFLDSLGFICWMEGWWPGCCDFLWNLAKFVPRVEWWSIWSLKDIPNIKEQTPFDIPFESKLDIWNDLWKARCSSLETPLEVPCVLLKVQIQSHRCTLKILSVHAISACLYSYMM